MGNFFTNLFKKKESSTEKQDSSTAQQPSTEQGKLRDTQLIPEQMDMYEFQFPEFSGNPNETITYQGTTHTLLQWINLFKDQGTFYIILPEKDYGEPRYSSDWNTYRNVTERKQIEKEYITLYVKYARFLVENSRTKSLTMKQNQFMDTNHALVWLQLAPKYKMLRREFKYLSDAMYDKVMAAMKAANV